MATDRMNRDEASQTNSGDTESLKNQTRETVADFRERARETGEQVREHSEALGAQAKEIASECYQQGREKAAAWERVLEDRIREKPIQSLLVAGGIGLLVGLLWRR